MGPDELSEPTEDVGDTRQRLIDLVGYVEHMVRLGEKAVFSLSEYRQIVYHEAALKGRNGIRHEVSDEDGPIWLSIDRLKRIPPPAVSEEIQSWITVAAEPTNEPIIEAVRTETLPIARVDQLLEEGIILEEDVQPAMRADSFGGEEEQSGLRDVIFRLQNAPQLETAVQDYVKGPWREWAVTEAPRRETIQVYDNFFSFQQSLQTTDGEQGVEIVWGIGMMRWRLEDGRVIDHPIIEQLAEIDIDTLSGRINIRPRQTEPTVPLKPLFAIQNPGAEQVHSFAKDFFAGFKEEDDLSPFVGEAFEPILREVAMKVHGEARYYPDELSDITDRSLPAIDGTLRVTNTWVIFGRRRSENFFINDLEKLKDAVKETEELPGPAKRLVTQPSATTTYNPGMIDIGQSTFSGGDDTTASPRVESEIETKRAEEFYFPKPFNEDQISIIRRLDESDGVVVQGPPGTGKTHTIANIICHYLATGRRVLVTSKGEGALTVLRDHIPDEIRNLTISLLTNERAGLKQLEQAATVLANTATQMVPQKLERDIKTGQERIGALRKNIRDIDQELGEWANRHLKAVGDGSSILPLELAQTIVGGRDNYGWLPDHPGSDSKYAPQFTDEDIIAVRNARKALGGNLLYLGNVLPSVADLPDAAIITAIHDDLVSAKRLDDDVTNRDVPVLSLSTPNATKRSSELLKAIERAVSMNKDLRSEPWLLEIVETWRDRGFEAEEVKLFNDLLVSARDLAKQRTEIIRYTVALPEGADGDGDLFNGVERAANDSRPFGLVPIGKSEPRARYERILIENRRPSGADDWKKVARVLQWRRKQIALATRWNAVKSEYNLPAMEGGIDEMGRWLTEIVRIIDRSTQVIEEDRKAIETELPDLFPYGMSASAIFSSQQAAEKAIEIIQVNLSKNRLIRSRKKTEELLERLATCAGPIVSNLKEFVSDSMGDPVIPPFKITADWQDLCRQLSKILEQRSLLDTVERVAGMVADSGAPNWANSLMSEVFVGDKDVWTPVEWRDAWKWRQQEAYLKNIDGRERLQELAENRLRHEDDLRRTFQKIVEYRTYLSLKKSMTEQVEAALVMFTSAIRRIGRGTGIRAQRFRRDARSAMEQSYAAVPCWIMPTWRISESLPAVLASFDLVIVDEASQSDISALPALVRGKKVLVVGDDKQVSPTAAFVEERQLLQLKHNFLQSQPFAPLMLPGGSLYDLANAIFPGRRIMLHEHFRCVEPIIRFSMRFYTEPIVPLRIPKPSERLDPPLVDVYLPHGRKNRSQINIVEAEAIVDEIEIIVNDPVNEGRTIGVISLIGSKQAHQIQTLLFERIGEEAYVKHDIACGNPSTFQGKERDIMFISMVECPETQSAKTSLLWEQRFNVAMSRARDRMYLFRSVDEKTLKPNDLKALTIGHFNSPMEQSATVGEELIELCDSEFERDVFRTLCKLGYRTTPQVKVAGYSIDLVVDGANDRRLAVELDGDQYHTPEQWMDDLVRQRTLERMGWRFWRCWGSSYYLDPDTCIDELVRTLESLGIEPMANETTSGVYTEHRIVDATKEDALITIAPERKEPVAQETDVLFVADSRAEDVSTHSYSPSITFQEVEVEYERVEVGDRVLIAYNDDPNRQHTIRISATEHDPDMEIIKVGHPLADAVLSAAVDEELEISAGGGTRIITIVGIEKNEVQLQAQDLNEQDEAAETNRLEGEIENKLINQLKENGHQPSKNPAPSIDAAASFENFGDDHTTRDENLGGGTGNSAPSSIDNQFGSPQTISPRAAQSYRFWEQTPLPDPRKDSERNIADRLLEIIEIEGPVLMHRVCHLYVEAAGIKRIGNKLRSQLLQAAKVAVRSRQITIENPNDNLEIGFESIVRPVGCPTIILRTRGPRSFEEIPPSEIKELMKLLFRTQPSWEEEHFYRQVLDDFDLKRLTTKVKLLLKKYAYEDQISFVEAVASSAINNHENQITTTGRKYEFEIFDAGYFVETLPDVLVMVMRSIHEIDDGFLARLSQESGRVRPILAKDPEKLYPGRTDLSHNSRDVIDGWYVGTNYSKRDVARILERICELAGLTIKDDLKGPAIDDIFSES